jgi:hypothetical protein
MMRSEQRRAPCKDNGVIWHRRIVVLLATFVLNACAKSEAEREAEARRQATPVRALPNGTIRLADADRRNLGLELGVAQQGDLPQSADRIGIVQTVRRRLRSTTGPTKIAQMAIAYALRSTRTVLPIYRPGENSYKAWYEREIRAGS